MTRDRFPNRWMTSNKLSWMYDYHLSEWSGCQGTYIATYHTYRVLVTGRILTYLPSRLGVGDKRRIGSPSFKDKLGRIHLIRDAVVVVDPQR